MKYKVGDEVLIKGKVAAVDLEKRGCPYWVGVSNGMGYWLSESDIAAKTYEQGMTDAWELAKKITVNVADGGFQCDVLDKIFGSCRASNILLTSTAEEALAKISEYEREKEIKVGDKVKHEIVTDVFIVTNISKGMIRGVDKNGVTHSFIFPNQYIKKTGKHIDIEGLLKQIGD